MKKECVHIDKKSKVPVIFGILAAFSAVWTIVLVLVYDKQLQPVMFFPDNLSSIPYLSEFFNQWHFVF